MNKFKARVFYYHIPQAAASTMETIVFNQYGFDNVFRFHSVRVGREAQVNGLAANDLNKYHASLGIAEFGLHQRYTGNWQLFTLLREPRSRIISHYNFVKNTPEHFFNHEARSLSLQEYLEVYPALEMDNVQTRLLAGKDINYNVTSPGTTTRADLEQAEVNLQNKFSAFGLMEYFYFP